jgi:hypothetical protein
LNFQQERIVEVEKIVYREKKETAEEAKQRQADEQKHKSENAKMRWGGVKLGIYRPKPSYTMITKT